MGDVGADLGLERLDVGELLFATEFLDEGDFDVLTVEVAGEIEEVDFDEAAGRGVLEGGTKADVDDGNALSDAGGIDTIGREDFVVEVQVRGGETERASALVAGFDGAKQAERSAEHGGGAVEASVQYVRADGRGTDHLTVGGVDGGNFVDGVAEAGGVAFHEGGVAGAIVSEMETGADADLPDTVCGKLFQECLRRNVGKFTSEWQDERDIHTKFLDEREFVWRGGEQRRRFVGMEDSHGMWIEGENNRGVGDDALVAEVDAVEYADGNVERAVQRGEFGE